MSETTTPGEAVVLGIILAACIWYIYRNLKRMFSKDVRQTGCGNCSGHSECASANAPKSQEECPP